ncbi:glycosyltransferase [Actinopolymorpha pittospori]|uniref:glycosyltransferase n=1 Tax=Actinopolymorpha pittospori TaxID=648752 RepID=UPI001789565B
MLTDYYLPGYKGGGLTRSVANLVDDLKGACSVWLLTRDRDLGDRRCYAGVQTRQWTRLGWANVAYVDWYSPADVVWAVAQARRLRPDLLYLNSYMSPFSSIAPLLARRVGLTRSRTLLAPRGELSSSALAIKSTKKNIYQRVARSLRLHRGVVFHASTQLEAADARRHHPNNLVLISADRLRAGGPPTLEVPPAALKIVQVSRIAPIKNLHRIIRALRQVTSPLLFDIWGPLEDHSYWNACQDEISKLPPHIGVTYRGPLEPEKVHETFAQSHASILCSLSENFGQSVAESLAAGCPVIVSDSLHWAEFVDGTAGWAVDPLDETQLSSTLAQVATTNQETWRSLRHGCSDALRKAEDAHGGLPTCELIASAIHTVTRPNLSDGPRE